MFSLTNSHRVVSDAVNSVFETLEERRLLSGTVEEPDEPVLVVDPPMLFVSLVKQADATDASSPADDAGEAVDDTTDSAQADATDETDPNSEVAPDDGIQPADDGDGIMYKDYVMTLGAPESLADESASGDTTDDTTDPTTDTTDNGGENPEVIYYTAGGIAKPTASLSSGILTITGTEGDDKIVIAKSKGDTTKLVVRLNGQAQRFDFAQVTSIIADLKGGNDLFKANQGRGAIAIPMHVQGGAGNDRIIGASGDDLLEGGDGNDKLKGASGNDTLLGNGGKDNLYGGAGDDVLNGGTALDELRGNAGSNTNEDSADRLLDRKQSDHGHRHARVHLFSLARLSDGSALSSLPDQSIWIGEPDPSAGSTDTTDDTKPADPTDDTSGEVLGSDTETPIDAPVK